MVVYIVVVDVSSAARLAVPSGEKVVVVAPVIVYSPSSPEIVTLAGTESIAGATF